MRYRNKIRALIWALVGSAALQSCFTGVESTPKITYKDVKKQHANIKTPEQELAETFVLESPRNWLPGKQFYVTSEKINLTMRNADRSTSMLVEGDTLIFAGINNVPSIVGEELADIVFDLVGKARGEQVVFSTGLTASQLADRQRFTIPFTIDLDLVGQVRNSLVGRRCYIRIPDWLTVERRAERGTKYTPVTIVNVVPANDVYPCMVVFKTDDGTTAAVYITADSQGGGAALSRDLSSTFSFSNPRDQYPSITDAMWDNIVNSRVVNGMTTTEARLALGSPSVIDRANNRNIMFERWTYSDGIYLIFEDGLLTRHN